MFALVDAKLAKDNNKHIQEFEAHVKSQQSDLKEIIKDKLDSITAGQQNRENAVAGLLAASCELDAAIKTIENTDHTSAELEVRTHDGSFAAAVKAGMERLSQSARDLLENYALACRAVDDSRRDLAVDLQLEEDVRRAQRTLLAGRHACRLAIGETLGVDSDADGDTDADGERGRKRRAGSRRGTRGRKRVRTSVGAKKRSKRGRKGRNKEDVAEESKWSEVDMRIWTEFQAKIEEEHSTGSDIDIDDSEYDDRSLAETARRVIKYTSKMLR